MIAHKTKATLQGRPSNTNKSTIDTTRPCAGGQSPSAPVITGTAPTARLGNLPNNVGLVEPTILKRVANLQLGPGCAENFGHPIAGYAALQYTLITTLILGRWGYAGFWRHPDIGYRGCTPLPYTPDDSRNSGDVKTSKDQSFGFLRCSAFSFRSHASNTQAEKLVLGLSELPSSILASISSTSSYGKRIPLVIDLLFLNPVAMLPPVNRCLCTIQENDLKKRLEVYVHLALRCLCTLMFFRCQNNEAPQVLVTPAGPLTKPLIGVTVMAESQSTQTRLKFTWRFLAVPAIAPDTKPIVLYTNATTEQAARDNCPGWMLFFAARLPVQEVRHV